MEKTRSTIYMVIISITILFAFFYYTNFSSHAETISGEEVFLTHRHDDSCYSTSTESCEGSHYVYQHGVQYADYHCRNCGHYTSHIVEADNWTCPYYHNSWQTNGVVKCTVCGTIHSTWSDSVPGNHTYQTKRLVCTIPEGQKDVGIKISADNSWTNQSVSLHLDANILNPNYTSGMISTSWGGNDMVASENGTYSVTATGKSGSTATASISINCIDKIAPVIDSVSANTQNMTASAITVAVSASDKESGLSDTAYSFDGGNTFSSSNSVLVNEGNDVQCVIKDKAGNTTSRLLKRGDYPYPEVAIVTPPPTPIEETQNEQGTEQKNEGQTENENKSENLTVPTSEVPKETRNKNTEKLDSGEDSQTKKESKQKKQSNTKVEGSRDDKEREKKSNKVNGKETDSKKVDSKNEENRDIDQESIKQDNNDRDLARGESEKINVYRMSETDKENSTEKDLNNNYNTEKDSNVDSNKEEIVNEEQIAKSAVDDFFTQRIYPKVGMICGILLVVGALAILGSILWSQTVLLYCYNGGEEYRKLGILHLKKDKKEFKLFLPEYMLDEAETPRYRLLIHKGLVRRNKKMDIVLQSEDHKLRQPMEECVDFVL